MSWTLLSNHGHVLLYLDAQPELRLRELAAAIGITERSVHTIVSDLVNAGYVSRERVGRRSRYTVCEDAPLRSPHLRGNSVGDLLCGLRPVGGTLSSGGSGGLTQPNSSAA